MLVSGAQHSGQISESYNLQSVGKYPKVFPVQTWCHTQLLEYHWLCPLCCTFTSSWQFFNYQSVFLNLLTFFHPNSLPSGNHPSIFPIILKLSARSSCLIIPQSQRDYWWIICDIFWHLRNWPGSCIHYFYPGFKCQNKSHGSM